MLSGHQPCVLWGPTGPLPNPQGPAHQPPLLVEGGLCHFTSVFSWAWPQASAGSPGLWSRLPPWVFLDQLQSLICVPSTTSDSAPLSGCSVVQSLSHVQLSATPGTIAHQVSLSFTISQSLLKLMSIESVIPFNHLILCLSLLLLPSVFQSIRVFSNESTLHIRWPKYWSFSFSRVLPINTQDWFPLGLSGLISLLSKGLSRVPSWWHMTKGRISKQRATTPDVPRFSLNLSGVFTEQNLAKHFQNKPSAPTPAFSVGSSDILSFFYLPCFHPHRGWVFLLVTLSYPECKRELFSLIPAQCLLIYSGRNSNFSLFTKSDSQECDVPKSAPRFWVDGWLLTTSPFQVVCSLLHWWVISLLGALVISHSQ